jgi:hypothetical protein
VGLRPGLELLETRKSSCSYQDPYFVEIPPCITICQWPWCRQEDNNKIDLRGIGRENGDCIQLSQNSVLWWTSEKPVMYVRVPKNKGIYL